MYKTTKYVYTLPTTSDTIQPLEEDDDQNELDTVFTIGNISYTIFIILCINNIIYPNPDDKENVAKFHLIMSNLWAFFPIMQAQGMWLKTLLALTCYFSMTWHWYNIGHELPMGQNFYRRFDVILSVMSIVCYSMSWMPKCTKAKIYSKSEERNSCCIKYCRGLPKQTAEWRCRWTVDLVINIITTVTIGIIIWYSEDFVIHICIVSVVVAFTLAVYQLNRGVMKVGSKNRLKFFFWAFSGVASGCIAFISKTNDGISTEFSDQLLWHVLWHTYVFGAAFCISRASEYLEYNLIKHTY